MQNQLLILLLALVFASSSAWQILASQEKASESQTAAATPFEAADKPMTLTGCVAQGEAAGEFVVSDVKNGTYRVTGTDASHYVGKRVQVSGTTSRRLQIVGGLWPTPNIAAQAGAIDPVRAAIAPLPGGEAQGTGAAPQLPELRAKKLRAVDGRCP